MLRYLADIHPLLIRQLDQRIPLLFDLTPPRSATLSTWFINKEKILYFMEVSRLSIDWRPLPFRPVGVRCNHILLCNGKEYTTPDLKEVDKPLDLSLYF